MKDIQRLIKVGATFEEFFAEATVNPNASLITGTICGYRVEEIETPLTQQVRYLDKLVDELAKGRKMEKILRSPWFGTLQRTPVWRLPSRARSVFVEEGPCGTVSFCPLSLSWCVRPAARSRQTGVNNPNSLSRSP